MHPESEKQAPAWAIVEIMGHRVIAGRISEVSRFGASFCRVEVDLPDGTIAAQEYSGSAIFCITPSDEATVRRRQASGTYAGPLAIDPPRSEALKLTTSEPRRYQFVPLWFCPEHSRPVDPNAPTCSECGQSLSPGGDCENFPECPKSPLPF